MLQPVQTETIHPDAGILFGQTPRQTWEKWIKADRHNRLALNAYSLLIETPGGKLVLVNTGESALKSLVTSKRISSKSIIPSMRALGHESKDVAVVVLTTLRAEDAGDSTRFARTGPLVPSFPNARYIVQRDEMKAALQPNERTAELYRPDTFAPLIERGQMEVVEGKHQIAEGIWVMYTGEPTGGHQCVMVDFGKRERLIYLGAIAPTPMHVIPTLIPSTTRDPGKTLEAKTEVLNLAADERFNVMFRHARPKEPAIYSIVRNGAGGWVLDKPL